METNEPSFLEQLQQIETLLKKAIDQADYAALLQSEYYRPDVTLGDAFRGILQAKLSHQDKTRRLPYTRTWV